MNNPQNTVCTVAPHKESKGVRAIKSIIAVVLALLLFFGVNAIVTYCYMMFTITDMIMAGELPDINYFTEADVVLALTASTEKALENAMMISLVSNLITILILCLSYTIRRKSPVKSLKINSVSPVRYVSFAIFGASLVIFLSVTLNLLAVFLGSIFPGVNSLVDAHNESYAMLDYSSNLGLELLSLALLTGITEELVFRGIGTGYLRKFMSPFFAVVISSVIFGLAHPSVVSFAYATVNGILLGVMYLKYDSVVPPIICHVFFNGTSSLLALIPDDKPLLILGLYILSIPVTFGLFVNIFLKYPTISDLLFDNKNRIKARNSEEAAVISELNAIKASGELNESDYKRLEVRWNRAKKLKNDRDNSTTENKGDSNTDETL